MSDAIEALSLFNPLNPKPLQLGIWATCGTSLFGAALGCYVGGFHILITAVKMPVFFIATLCLTFAALHITLLLAGSRERWSHTLALTTVGLGGTGIALGSVSPALALFATCGHVGNYATYLAILLLTTTACVIGGVMGARQLYAALGVEFRDRSRCLAVLGVWTLAYQFTGAQVIWLLRPWIGSSFDIEGILNLDHALTGNFYVAVWEAAVNLISSLGGVR